MYKTYCISRNGPLQSSLRPEFLLLDLETPFGTIFSSLLGLNPVASICLPHWLAVVFGLSFFCLWRDDSLCNWNSLCKLEILEKHNGCFSAVWVRRKSIFQKASTIDSTAERDFTSDLYNALTDKPKRFWYSSKLKILDMTSVSPLVLFYCLLWMYWLDFTLLHYDTLTLLAFCFFNLFLKLLETIISTLFIKTIFIGIFGISTIFNLILLSTSIIYYFLVFLSIHYLTQSSLNLTLSI